MVENNKKWLNSNDVKILDKDGNCMPNWEILHDHSCGIHRMISEDGSVWYCVLDWVMKNTFRIISGPYVDGGDFMPPSKHVQTLEDFRAETLVLLHDNKINKLSCNEDILNLTSTYQPELTIDNINAVKVCGVVFEKNVNIQGVVLTDNEIKKECKMMGIEFPFYKQACVTLEVSYNDKNTMELWKSAYKRHVNNPDSVDSLIDQIREDIECDNMMCVDVDEMEGLLDPTDDIYDPI